jgi:asparagine synthase (glutamine-hydrolysing)
MKELSINLSTGGWTNSNGCYVKGFVFYGSEILREIDLVNVFLLCKTEKDLRQKLEVLNGQFSVVIVRGSFVWMAVDKLRQFPLFYSSSNESWVIADNTSSICKTNKVLNRRVLTPFLLSGYCPGHYTLLQNVFQVEAGQFVEINNTGASKRNYYHYFLRKKNRVEFSKRTATIGSYFKCCNFRLYKIV